MSAPAPEGMAAGFAAAAAVGGLWAADADWRMLEWKWRPATCQLTADGIFMLKFIFWQNFDRMRY
jgi:hypothetical protein